MNSIEAQALHAIMDDDLDEAKRLVSTLLKGEASGLRRAANQLSRLAESRESGAILATGDAKQIEDSRSQNANGEDD